MDGLKARLSFDAVAYDYDDEYLTIDTDTHTININNVSRLFGVQYDGNSKLIKFRIRNQLSEIQKMQDSIVYINWIDQKGVKGQSIAINKTINNDTCEFAWKVPFDALKNSGVLHFAMSAVMTENGSSVIDQRWSTQIASVITPDGIYIKSYTPSSEEEDRIAQIYNELSNMIQSQVNSLNKAKVDKPSISDNGKILRAKDGEVEWVDVGQPTDAQTNSAVASWLNQHPEATTTVQDHSITPKKLSKELLIGKVFTESDFSLNANGYVLQNDIVLTHPIDITISTKLIDFGGYTIRLSDDYTDSYIFKINNLFKGTNEDWTNETVIKNGIIECNTKDCSVFLINSIGNTFIHDIVIKNNVRGMFTYDVNRKNTKVAGAQVRLDNIVISHSEKSNDENIGLDIQFGDSSISNIWVQYYKYGVRIAEGYNNLLENVHPWGLPKTEDSQYFVNKQMKIAFLIFTANHMLYSCYADTFEPEQVSAQADYNNGGIGFYICAENIKLDSCFALVHPRSNNNNHVYYYYDDINPTSKLPGYLNSNTMTNCSVSLSGGAVFKGIGLQITNNAYSTLSYMNCSLSERMLESNIQGRAVNRLNTWNSKLKNNESEFYMAPNNMPAQHAKINDKDIIIYGTPRISPNFNSYSSLINEIKSQENVVANKDYPLYFLVVNTKIYVYNPETNKLAELQTLNWFDF